MESNIFSFEIPGRSNAVTDCEVATFAAGGVVSAGPPNKSSKSSPPDGITGA